MKNCLNPREIPRAQAIFHRIPLLSSQYSYQTTPWRRHWPNQTFLKITHLNLLDTVLLDTSLPYAPPSSRLEADMQADARNSLIDVEDLVGAESRTSHRTLPSDHDPPLHADADRPRLPLPPQRYHGARGGGYGGWIPLQGRQGGQLGDGRDVSLQLGVMQRNEMGFLIWKENELQTMNSNLVSSRMTTYIILMTICRARD